MSDGPYKTLKMSRTWKRLAKVAANEAHTPAELAEALRPALLDDWASVRPSFAEEIRAALGDDERGNLFPEVTLAETQRVRSGAANPMEALLAEQAYDTARDGQVGPQAYEATIKASLDERAIQRARQIEEHYLREASPGAGRLRAKLSASIGAAGTDQLAAGIAAGASVRSLAPKVDRSGLEEGVPL